METWKPIRHNNNYQISNRGRIRTYNYKSNGQLLTLTQKNAGHENFLVYAILCKNYGKKAFSVNRLVYEHFVGKIPNNYTVFNKDGDPWNNCVENLVLMKKDDSMFVKLNKHQIKKKKDVMYDYYIDGVLVGGMGNFIKIVGNQTKQNVIQRFRAWETRKKDSKWHISEGVRFNGHICTRKLKPAQNKRFNRMKDCLNLIKDAQ